MGYTHYWYRKPEFDWAKFKRISEDCGETCADLAIPLSESQFTPIVVSFNGIGDEGCEPFEIPRVSSGRLRPDGTVFEFCKTRRLPYDLAVQVCLLIFKHHLGEAFEIHSDGDENDWKKARETCQRLRGYGMNERIERG